MHKHGCKLHWPDAILFSTCGVWGRALSDVWDRVLDPVAAQSAAVSLPRESRAPADKSAALRAAAGSKTRPHTGRERPRVSITFRDFVCWRSPPASRRMPAWAYG